MVLDSTMASILSPRETVGGGGGRETLTGIIFHSNLVLLCHRSPALFKVRWEAAKLRITACSAALGPFQTMRLLLAPRPCLTNRLSSVVRIPVLLRLICMMLPFHDEGFDLSSVASLPCSLFAFGYSWPTSSSPALLLYLMAHYLLGGISAETFVGTCRGKEVAIKVLSTKKLDDSALDRFKEQCAKLKCVTCCRIPALIETNSFRSIGKS